MVTAISTLNNFIDALSAAPETELIFTVEGEDIQPDYHVTEIKLAHVRGLDCGKQTDEWDESLVQLLDGPAEPSPNAEFMSVATFLKIAGAGDSAIKAFDGSELYFEFSSGNRALSKLSVHNVSVTDGRTIVELGPVSAICKPAFRGQTENVNQSGCCGTTPEGAAAQAGGACCAPSTSPSACCA